MCATDMPLAVDTPTETRLKYPSHDTVSYSIGLDTCGAVDAAVRGGHHAQLGLRDVLNQQ
jgi:hypothetical protein